MDNKALKLGAAAVLMLACYLAVPEEYNHQQKLDNTDLTLDQLIHEGLRGRCDGPLLLRNVFQPNPEDVQVCQDNHDECFLRVTDRLRTIFGDNSTLFAYPMAHLASPKKHGVRHTQGVHLTLAEYLEEPQYSNHVVHALHQVGNKTQYQHLMESPNVPNTYQGFTKLPWHKYMGSQLFLSRTNHTGSHMHYEFGTNIMVLLAGSKRWIDVHPNYLYQANCSVGHNGFYGHCYPNDYTGENIAGRVSMDEYEQALLASGVPKEAIVTFVMNAGDVLLNCDLWAHAVENLAPAVGFSMRYMANPIVQMQWRWSTLALLKDSLWMSFQEMFSNPGSMTLIGSIVAQSGKMDKDERMKDLGVLNQRKTSHF